MNELIAKLKKLPIFKYKWVQFLMYLIKNFLDDNCTQKAASLTYTTLLSIVPILTLLVVILSSIPQLAEAREQIQNLIFSNILPSTSLQVTKYLNQFASNSSNLTLIGIGILFFTTISTLITIETAFNQIWRVEKKETSWFNLVRYWAVITLVPLILGVAFIVSSTVQSLSFLNHKIAGYSIDWAVWVQIGSIAVMMMGLVGMYWFIPRCQVRFKHALAAGIVVGIIFELLKLTFGVIVDNFTSYKAVYGAFAILPLFLLWIYISWNVILLGVQISYCLTIFETKEIHPRHALFSLMDMLNVMYREHKKGNAVTEAGLRDVLGRQEMPNWYTYISFLQDNNLIATSDKNEYVLKRSLTGYSFWDFYKNLPYPLPHEKDLRKLKNHAPWTLEWINTLARGEAMLRYNFDVPMAYIFENMVPRQQPDAKDIEPDSGKKGKGNKLANQREASGLSGGQVSDVVNEDKRIKETDAEQATGFDGTLDFNGQAAATNEPTPSSTPLAALNSHPEPNPHTDISLAPKSIAASQQNRHKPLQAQAQVKAQPIESYLNATNFENMNWDTSAIDDDSFTDEITTTTTVYARANSDYSTVDATALGNKLQQLMPAMLQKKGHQAMDWVRGKLKRSHHGTQSSSPKIITEKDKPQD